MGITSSAHCSKLRPRSVGSLLRLCINKTRLKQQCYRQGGYIFLYRPSLHGTIGTSSSRQFSVYDVKCVQPVMDPNLQTDICSPGKSDGLVEIQFLLQILVLIFMNLHRSYTIPIVTLVAPSIESQGFREDHYNVGSAI